MIFRLGSRARLQQAMTLCNVPDGCRRAQDFCTNPSVTLRHFEGAELAHFYLLDSWNFTVLVLLRDYLVAACISPELFRRPVVERAVRAFAVVLPPPVRQGASYVVERAEPAGVQTLVAQPSVEALDTAILHRPSGLDVHHPYPRGILVQAERRIISLRSARGLRAGDSLTQFTFRFAAGRSSCEVPEILPEDLT